MLAPRKAGETAMRLGFALAALVTTALPATAQQPPAPNPPAVDPEAGVPVFADSIADRPYIVLGVVTARIRKPTVFSHATSRAKIYRELWERARTLGADAVIDARYGSPHITGFSWNQINASGTMIRFTGPAK